MLQWTRQFGSSPGEFGQSVTVDAADNVYITGYTLGSLESSSAGGFDVFVRKYSSSGTLAWAFQFGSSDHDYGTSVSIDGNGDLYVGGATLGALDGVNAGLRDLFVSKYDSDGVHLWTRQMGTSSQEAGGSVAGDSNGNVYLGGTTEGHLGAANAGGLDVVLIKYDSDGAVLWSRQFGTSSREDGGAVMVDADNRPYISGITEGTLTGTSAGGGDTFVRKYGVSGNVLWTDQQGTSLQDTCNGIASDGNGNAYVTGQTGGTWPGQSKATWVHRTPSSPCSALSDRVETAPTFPHSCTSLAAFPAPR